MTTRNKYLCPVCKRPLPTKAPLPGETYDFGDCSPRHWGKVVQQIWILRREGATRQEIVRLVGAPLWFIKSAYPTQAACKLYGPLGELDEAEKAELIRRYNEPIPLAYRFRNIGKQIRTKAFKRVGLK